MPEKDYIIYADGQAAVRIKAPSPLQAAAQYIDDAFSGLLVRLSGHVAPTYAEVIVNDTAVCAYLAGTFRAGPIDPSAIPDRQGGAA